MMGDGNDVTSGVASDTTQPSGSRSSTQGNRKSKTDRDRKQNTRKQKTRKRDEKATLRWLKWTLEKMRRKRADDRKSVCFPTCTSVTKFAILYACVLLLRAVLGRCFEGMLHNLEKLYLLKWPELEFILGAEKIGFAISFLIISYYGNGMHKPLAVMCGTFLCSIGSFVCSIPNFLNNGTLINETSSTMYYESGLCFTGRNMTSSNLVYQYQCEAHDARTPATEADVFSIVCLGYFAVGIGTALYATLGLVYIEENGDKRENVLIFGLLLALYGLGDVLGSLIMWAVSHLPHQISGDLTVKEVQAEAWWIPPLVLGCFFLLPGLFFLPFPRWIREPAWLVKRRIRRETKFEKLIESEMKRLEKRRRKLARKKRRAQIRARAKAQREREATATSGGEGELCGDASSQTPVSRSQGSANAAFEGDVSDSSSSGVLSGNDVTVSDNPAGPSGDGREPTLPGVAGKKSDSEPEKSESSGESDEEANRENGNIPDSSRQEQQDSQPSQDQEAKDEKGKSKTKKVGFDEDKDEEHIYEVESNAESVKRREKTEKRKDMLGRKLRDLPKHIGYLCRRPVFVLALVGTILWGYHPGGYRPTLPQFASTAYFTPNQPYPNTLVGVSHGLGAAIGAMVGGMVVYVKGFSLLNQFTFLSASLCAHVLMTSLLMPLSCDTEIFGVTNKTDSYPISWKSKCNEQCDCTGVQYEPVCSPDGLLYPSSCHAGCPHMSEELGFLVNNFLLYMDCSCVTGGFASRGFCDFRCQAGSVFYFLLFLASLAHSLGYISILLVFLRSVPEKLRSISIGLAVWLTYIFAIVPGKAVFDYVTDTSCVYDDVDCYEEKKCWYNNGAYYRYLQHGTNMAFQAVAAIFFIGTTFAMRSKVYAAAKVETGKEKRSQQENGGSVSNSNPSQFDNIGYTTDEGHRGQDSQGHRGQERARPSDPDNSSAVSVDIEPHANSGESIL